MEWIGIVISGIAGLLIGAVFSSALWRRRLAQLDLQLLNLTETNDRLEEEVQQLREVQRHCQEEHSDIRALEERLQRAENEVLNLRNRLRIAKTDIDLEHARKAAAEARIRALEAILGQNQTSAETGDQEPPAPEANVE